MQQYVDTQAGMKPTSDILLYPCAKHKHALSDEWKKGQVNLKVDVYFSQSQSNLTAYKMKQMDIFALVADGIKKKLSFYKCYILYVCKERKKTNSKINLFILLSGNVSSN